MPCVVFLKALSGLVGDFGKFSDRVALAQGEFCHNQNPKSEGCSKATVSGMLSKCWNPKPAPKRQPPAKRREIRKIREIVIDIPKRNSVTLSTTPVQSVSAGIE